MPIIISSFDGSSIDRDQQDEESEEEEEQKNEVSSEYEDSILLNSKEIDEESSDSNIGFQQSIDMLKLYQEKSFNKITNNGFQKQACKFKRGLTSINIM